MHVVLSLREPFLQSLLRHYLELRGYAVYSSLAEQPASVDSTLITDDCQLLATRQPVTKLIWLLGSPGELRLHLLPRDITSGVLCGRSTIEEMLLCLQYVEQGQGYLSSQLLKAVGPQPQPPAADLHLERLTRRERQIFDLIRQGVSMSSIADQLFISIHTAENHRANIQKKLELSGRLSLVRFALSSNGSVN